MVEGKYVVMKVSKTRVQQGTHEELVEQTNCKYYELWSAQAKYYA